MRLLLLTLLSIISTFILAQDGKYQMGAASSGLGGSSLTVTNGWSIFNNVGALGAVDETSAFAAYQNRYNIPGFQVIGGGFVHAMTHATAGIAYYRIGDNIYNQQRVSFAIGNKFQMVSLGAGVNVIQYHAESLDTRRRLAIEFGGVAQIIPELSFGAHIFNLKESQIVPTVMKAGLSYRPSDQLMINLETEKELGFSEVFKAGLQYQLIEPLFFRTGISTKPFKSAFGFGLTLSGFLLDYAYISNPNLGGIHELSLAYKLKDL
ncbi:MAG: hypothetical protein ACJA08_002395 [Cyclobacteriaceae bacterium]|jgi:hypothetical protein